MKRFGKLVPWRLKFRRIKRRFWEDEARGA